MNQAVADLLIRRCEVLLMEPRETLEFDLMRLAAGGDGLDRKVTWMALAPHLDEPVEIDGIERELLGQVSPSCWVRAGELDAPADVLKTLLDKGLLLAQAAGVADAHRERDERLRGAHWHPLGAVMHAFTRWDGVDAVKNMKESGTETALEMRRVLGVPPVQAKRLGGTEDRLVRLPDVEGNAFDELMHRRVTCRNFDASRAVPLAAFSKVLERALAAQDRMQVTDDLVFLKKNVPSGGGLHPMEAYLVIQNVEGIASGLYHYRSEEHALEPMTTPQGDLGEFVMECVAQQHWFRDAHVLVVLAPRFDRTFWKYRQHAKSYRVVALEAGHISQTIYLSATDLGLGAFVTGAINEKHIERAFGLDPLTQGALAVCGFGWRDKVMINAELDPGSRIWS